MPTISRFLGILILMYFRDHAPAHFHVKYGDYEAQIQISPFGVIKGKLPARVLSLVLEWTLKHEKDLLKDWELASDGQPLNQIEPLD